MRAAALVLTIAALAGCAAETPRPAPSSRTLPPPRAPVPARRSLLPTRDGLSEALRWLARHQGADGGWHGATFASACTPDAPCAGPGYADWDIGLTGLSVLAFLGAGYGPRAREQALDACVGNGLDFLVAAQDEGGCVGPRVHEYMYNHAIATLALTEAYQLTTTARYGTAARRAIAFLEAAQNPGRAWRYTARPGDNDTSVTAWCVMALKSAEIAGLEVAPADYEGARAWLASVTTSDGEVGYDALGKTGMIIRGKNEAWGTHPTMTAVGLLSRIYMDRTASDPVLAKQAEHIARDPAAWDEARHTIDFYYWYFASVALSQLDGHGGQFWKEWHRGTRDALLTHQVSDETCARGSWDPSVDRWGFIGGRVYSTALNALTLEALFQPH